VILPFGVLLAVFGIEMMLRSPRRRWRAAAAVALALVPLHFAFFIYDYYGDYRVRSATWFNNNRRAALEWMIAYDDGHAPAVYLSRAHIPYIDDYWRLYLLKHHREDLIARTHHIDRDDSLDIHAIPKGSLVLASRKDLMLHALVEQGELRRLMEALEPGDPTYLSVLQR
jgi:hypothetical protein